MGKRKTKAVNSTASHWGAHFLASALLGAALVALLLAGAAQLLCRVDFSTHLVAPLVTTAACVASLCAALLFAFLRGEKGLLHGLLMGAVFVTVVWCASLARGQTEFASPAGAKTVALLAAGAVGGYIGMLLRIQKRRIH